MNAKGNLYRGRLSIPMNQRLLVVSLGLLMSGLAHGTADDALNEKCHDFSSDEALSPEIILECAPVRREGTGFTEKHPASADNGAGKGTGDASKNDAVDEHAKTDLAPPSTTGNDAEAAGNAKSGKADKPATSSNDAQSASGADSKSADKSGNEVKTVNDVGNGGTDNPAEKDNADKTEDATGDGSETSKGAVNDDADESPHASQTKDDASDEQHDKVVAVDHKALQVDGAMAGPDNMELFNVDIETAESAEGEIPSAAGRDLFNLGFATHRTSDNYKAHSYLFSYRNHRREWFWPWQENTKRGLDWGLDVDRTKGDSGTTGFTGAHAQGMLGGYLTKGTYLQAQVGRHDLETDAGDRAITTHHVTAMFGLDKSFSMQLDTDRDFIYSGGSVKGGITKQLTAQDHSVSFRWRPEERIRLQGVGGFRKYDDTEENIARQADISALYGVSPGWPWIWAGIGAQVLRYDQEVSDYWSPNRFTAYGPRFESSFPLLGRLSASAAANLNRQGENGTHGYGYDVSGGFQYRLYQQVYLRLDMSKSKSLQNGNTWKSDNVMFTLSGPLF